MILLDKDTAPAFAGLYDGDIMECTDREHISFGTFEERRAASLIMLHQEDDAYYIDWIYTHPDFRGRGIASRLLFQTMETISQLVAVDELHVICPGEELRGFFESANFLFEDDTVGTLYSAELQDMTKLPKREKSANCMHLSELGRKDLKIVNNVLYQAGDLADSVELPIAPEQYAECSYVCIKDHKLLGLMLFKQDSERSLDIAYALKAEGAEVPFLNMLCTVREEVTTQFPPETRVRTSALNDASSALFEKLFPRARKEEIYSAWRLMA